MQDRASAYPGLKLAQAVYGFVIVGIVAFGLLAAVVLQSRSSALLDSALDAAVRVRTDAAARSLARGLHNDWTDLKFLAEEIPTGTPARIGGLMDGMRGDATRISWIGHAAVDGTVLAASDGLLAGEDVGARPWFRNGLQGAFAGDVHEAVLLQNLLAPDDPAGLRFVDLAMPVRGDGGQVLGVAGVHINFAWAQALLREEADRLELTLYLVDANGEIILSTSQETPTAEELQVLRSARSGIQAAVREVWPDGEEYFSSLVPKVAYGDLPNFGWRLIGRLDADRFHLGASLLQGWILLTIGAAICGLFAVTAIFVAIFIRPVEVLGNSAEEIAEGADIYPPDITRTRETAQLSSALSRLQASRRN